MMRKAGVPKSVIMQLTGHKTMAMFSRYNTVDKQDAKDALDKLNRLLERQVKSGSPADECSHSAPEGVDKKKRERHDCLTP